jgi:predicted branched-subunit amino acid permease
MNYAGSVQMLGLSLFIYHIGMVSNLKVFLVYNHNYPMRQPILLTL